jgi:hypothetical protein
MRIGEKVTIYLGVGRRAMTSFHPKEYDLINLYEVTNEQGVALWGGNNQSEAINWYLRGNEAGRILVSAWDSNEEDAYMIGRPIDITDIVLKAMAYGVDL